MVDFKNILSDMRKRREESRRKRIEERAREIFQITEFGGQLWFTCNNMLYCPCSLIGEAKDAVTHLNALRKLYIDRHV